MAALAIGSTLVAAYGQYKSSKAQAEAKKQQAHLSFLKANEVLSRNQVNNELLMESALVHQGTQAAQVAGSGLAGGEASRALIRNTVESTAKQIDRNNRAAEWEANMIRIGAESQIGSAEQIETAGFLGSLATLGFGLAKTAEVKPGKGGVTP